MGGGFDDKQIQQQMILDKAYSNMPNVQPEEIVEQVHELTASTEVPNPDLFDKAYVLLRTIVPGWMMGLFIIVGAVTMATVIFKKQLRNLILIWSDSLRGSDGK